MSFAESDPPTAPGRRSTMTHLMVSKERIPNYAVVTRTRSHGKCTALPRSPTNMCFRHHWWSSPPGRRNFPIPQEACKITCRSPLVAISGTRRPVSRFEVRGYAIGLGVDWGAFGDRARWWGPGAGISVHGRSSPFRKG